MPAAGWRRRWVAWSVVAGALGIALAWHSGIRPTISSLWPLDLSSPGGWLVDHQLADLRRDPALCGKVMANPLFVGHRIPDRSSPDNSCGWKDAYRLVSLSGTRLSVGAASCELTAALTLWVAHEVQPLASRHFGSRIARIEHLGAYACRNIRGDPANAKRLSQHATANALDVRGFVLADGRRVRVKSHWGKDSPEGRFLADVLKGACNYFRVAIGPAYNAAHRDHFHLDRGRWRACR